MDPQRERIQEDLRGLITGDSFLDDIHLQMYSTDASLYQYKPLGVVRPRSREDVAALVRYAQEYSIPLHARGAGTGLAGESIGQGIVIDFSRHMRRNVAIELDHIRTQPGVILERLNNQLRPLGRHFGPDPAMSHVTTMGSVLALDASGSHFLRYGSARSHVLSVDAVLSDGSLVSFGKEPLVEGVSHDPDEKKRDLINRMVALIRDNHVLIEEHAPRTAVNRCGYHLRNILKPTEIDMAKFLCGSEGTLALFTEASFSIDPLPKYRALIVLLFHSLENAAIASREILQFEPSSCDLMDRRHLGLAREGGSRVQQIIPAEAEALLLVEFEGDEAPSVRDRVRAVSDHALLRKRLAFDSRQAFSGEDMDLLWSLARRVVPTLYRIKGSIRAMPFIEDIAVPPDRLAEFLLEAQNVFKKHHVTSSLFGHAGHGQLHFRPFLDPTNPEHVALMEDLASDMYGAVFAVKGTISGEHAAGFSRTQFLRRQYGELFDVFCEVKRIFDPKNLFNPGKVIGDGTPLLTRNLRPEFAKTDHPPPPPATVEEPAGTSPQEIQLQLVWAPSELELAARNCNGCGACRAQDPSVRMCPIFRFSPSEEASPRAKANLLRGILTGQLGETVTKLEEFKAVADLCVNCHMCRHECPAKVDIPKLVLEAKAEFVANNGLSPTEWLLTHLDAVGRWGTTLRAISNFFLRTPRARWLLEKSAGIAQQRKLPQFARIPFLTWAHRRKKTRLARGSGNLVALFVDTYANWFDPVLAQSLVKILEHSGITVFVPPEQAQSAMAMLSIGAVDLARKTARRNVKGLVEAVRQGAAVVCLEPTAALCLKHEYPSLINDDDTRLVADAVVEAGTYLWGLHGRGKLKLDFKPIHASVAYHTPCHTLALQVGTPSLELLKLIPGLGVRRIERGCSGMAGTWGIRQKNFRNSIRAGWPLISAMRDSQWQAGSTECSACKMQMEQGTNKPTVHPLKLLASAYGFLPEDADLFATRSRDLIVT